VPALGLGTWQLTGRACREAVKTALELGYRHLDTAQMYGPDVRQRGRGGGGHRRQRPRPRRAVRHHQDRQRREGAGPGASVRRGRPRPARAGAGGPSAPPSAGARPALGLGPGRRAPPRHPARIPPVPRARTTSSPPPGATTWCFRPTPPGPGRGHRRPPASPGWRPAGGQARPRSCCGGCSTSPRSLPSPRPRAAATWRRTGRPRPSTSTTMPGLPSTPSGVGSSRLRPWGAERSRSGFGPGAQSILRSLYGRRGGFAPMSAVGAAPRGRILLLALAPGPPASPAS